MLLPISDKYFCLRLQTAVFAFVAAILPLTSSAKTSKAVWWWRSEDAARVDVSEKRLAFLAEHGVNEIYFWADLKKYPKETRALVKAAGKKGMRVALLSGDVSWISPENRGFAEVASAYLAYQKSAAADERFYALHLDVEPHQDRKLSDKRKWQLYADFVLRASAEVHAAGENIEWDIPFWLDNIFVEYGERKGVSLLEVVMGCSDCVALMSYRDTAEAMLDVSKTEIALAAKGRTRVVLGAETGETGEGSIVTFFEEGSKVMDRELAKVEKTLESAKVPAGAGIAIHHLGSWEKLLEKEDKK